MTRLLHRTGRAAALTALTASTVLASASVSVADVISNNLDPSVDAVAETMPLNVGGPSGTTRLYVQTQNGDGKNGCNLTGATSLVLSVVSSNTQVATVSPSSVTFTSCGDTPTLTVTPLAVGSTTVSVSQTSNTTAGTFNLAPATFAVNVARPANTAPVITVTGVTGGASYDKASVPSATCQVTDAEDGTSNFPATLSSVSGAYASDGIGSQQASCSYTDQGGLTASSAETYSIVDPSPPVIGYALDPTVPDGDNGWYKGRVTLVWDVSEPQSPNSLQRFGCADQDITADQAATTYNCSATSAGGTTAQRSVTIQRDGTAPVVSYDGVSSGTPNANGWYNTDVTVGFTATDATSGVAAASQAQTTVGEGNAVTVGSPVFTDNAGNTSDVDAAMSPEFKIDKTAPTLSGTATSSPNSNGWYMGDVTIEWAGDDSLSGIDPSTQPDDTVITGEGADLGAGPVSIHDNAGNISNPATVAGFKIDRTAPSQVAFVGGPEDGGRYFPTTVPAQPTCVATDVLSGLDSCTVTGYSAAVGTHTLLATAIDQAGNVSTRSISYNIRKLALRGFFSPVDMGGVFNTVKGGSTVPLKFQVFDEGVEQTSTGVVSGFKAQRISCSTGAAEDLIEQLATTGGTSLRYDGTGGQFIQNWKTPTGAGNCYSATMSTIDGSSVTALFKLK